MRHFFAIATFGGFSKASRATGVSQPALSLGLKRLEKTLGLTLIDRSARPFELTPAGNILLAFCHRFQGSFESAMTSLGAAGISIQKRLRVGTALSVGVAPLEELCAKVEEQKEPFELELLEQNTYQLLSDVHELRLDAAFVPNDVFDSRLRFFPLTKDQLIFVVGSKHQGKLRGPSWKKGASCIPLITFPRETPMRSLTDKICVTEDVEFKTVYAINSIEALKLLVEQSRGGAFILRSLVGPELKAKRLFEERLPIKLPHSGVSLVLPPEDAQNEHSKTVARLLGVSQSRPSIPQSRRNG